MIYLIFFAFLALLVIYICYNTESFMIPQNIVDPGDHDFGIEPPGVIADQGSFTTDMYKYVEGTGSL